VLHKQTSATSQIEVADKVRARRLERAQSLQTEAVHVQAVQLTVTNCLMVSERAA
jgi:hypothetical protein